MKRKGKGKGGERIVIVIQGYHSYDGWEDIYTAKDEDDAANRLAQYNADERFVAHRIVRRVRRD